MPLNINGVVLPSKNPPYINGVRLDRVRLNGVEVWKRVEVGAYMTLHITKEYERLDSVEITLAKQNESSGQTTFSYASNRMTINIPCTLRFDLTVKGDVWSTDETRMTNSTFYIKRIRNGVTENAASTYIEFPYNAKTFNRTMTVNALAGDKFYLYKYKGNSYSLNLRALTLKATVTG